MSYTALLDEQVTIYNPDTDATNRYGDVVQTFDAGTASPARVQRLDAGADVAENVIDRDTRITRYIVFLPAGTTISSLSELEHDGRRLRVDGEVARVHGRSGEHHVEANAMRIEG